MPIILKEDIEVFQLVRYSFPQVSTSVHSLIITSMHTIFQRGKMDYMMSYPPADTLMTDTFVKGFTHRASEMGVNGLDIVEMLEFIRRQYEQVRTGKI